MYVMQVPVLTTAHIRPETGDFLIDEGADNLNVVASYEDGWFIHVGDLNGLEGFELLSSDLQDVLRWAFSNGHEWIRIDSFSGSVVEELPVYR